MKSAILIGCLALATSAFAAEWCYSDEDGCGPNTPAWGGSCQTGQRQTPIQLPGNVHSTARSHIRTLNAYKSSSFKMTNNGHSVAIEFAEDLGTFPFPDPLLINNTDYNAQGVRKYKFASAHMHWGPNRSVGSEHCVGKSCSAMELHLVHYLASYPNLNEAVASGDESALAVLGVFINEAMFFGGQQSLSPIVKNLDQVKHASHGSEGTLTVAEPLDFTPLINTEDPLNVYTYKGSLTTPGCNEQVNWYVVQSPAVVRRGDVDAFRTKLEDSRGKPLNTNYRPLQARHDRPVTLVRALGTQ